MEAVKGDR